MEKRIIESGEFEYEFLLSRTELADILRDLADQITKESRLKVSSENWEIPVEFQEPIKLKVDFEGDGKKKLKIKIEFKNRSTRIPIE
jgi:amphi-Trp domain-containing protein